MICEFVKRREIFVSFHFSAVMVEWGHRFTFTRLVLHHSWCLFIDLNGRERKAFFWVFHSTFTKVTFCPLLNRHRDGSYPTFDYFENLCVQRKLMTICAEGHSLCQVRHETIHSSLSPTCPTWWNWKEKLGFTWDRDIRASSLSLDLRAMAKIY